MEKPCTAMDGVAGFVGSSQPEGLEAIAGAARGHRSGVPLGVRRHGPSPIVSGGPGSGKARLLTVGFDAAHETRVSRGENRHRTLLEFNIVRSFGSAGVWTGEAVTVRVPPPERETPAVLLQAEDGRILATARLANPAS